LRAAASDTSAPEAASTHERKIFVALYTDRRPLRTGGIKNPADGQCRDTQ